MEPKPALEEIKHFLYSRYQLLQFNKLKKKISGQIVGQERARGINEQISW
jgi:hypothetical protein